MKHIATVALMLNLGVAASTAQQRPVKMTFSGSTVATTINLQPGTVTDEEHLAGDGTLGRFTFRQLRADVFPFPGQPPSTCSPQVGYISRFRAAGAYFASQMEVS